jgi:hypothetical protein
MSVKTIVASGYILAICELQAPLTSLVDHISTPSEISSASSSSIPK